MTDAELFRHAVVAVQRTGLAVAEATDPQAAARIMLAAAVTMLAGSFGDAEAADMLRALADGMDNQAGGRVIN